MGSADRDGRRAAASRQRRLLRLRRRCGGLHERVRLQPSHDPNPGAAGLGGCRVRASLQQFLLDAALDGLLHDFPTEQCDGGACPSRAAAASPTRYLPSSWNAVGADNDNKDVVEFAIRLGGSSEGASDVYDSAMEAARQFVAEHWPAIDAVADKLLERVELTGEEVRRLVAADPPDRPLGRRVNYKS